MDANRDTTACFLPKHEIRGPSLKCTQLAWQWELTPPQHYPNLRLKIPDIVQREKPRHSEEEEGNRVDEHLEETNNITVRNGGE